MSPDQSGWVYFRGPYNGDEKVTPAAATRTDTGRSINVEYNLWIDRLGDSPYLQLIDYVDTAGVSFTYDITYTRSNNYHPQFAQTEFRVDVPEDVAVGAAVLLPNATDKDPDQQIVYSLGGIGADVSLPFEINATSGAVRVLGRLDREQVAAYTFSVIASDDGTPARKSAAAVQVTVLDVNDNAPRFDPVPTDIDIEESAAVGYELATISATDPDGGDNGDVTVLLVNVTSLFAFNTTTGRLSTAASLAGRPRQYTLLFVASDQGQPKPLKTELTVTVGTVASNKHAPKMIQSRHVFEVQESAEVGTPVRLVVALDRDIGSAAIVNYKFGEDILLPFVIDQNTGTIFTRTTLDREAMDHYTFHVLAVDNGAPPTGPRTATAEVTVTIADVNDNAPAFPLQQFNQSVQENSPVGTEVLRTKAVDLDAGDNGYIASYYLQPPSAAFAVLVDGDFAVVRTTQVLDAEFTDNYRVNLVAVDKGTPPMSTSVVVSVHVTDVNDNSPHFIVSHKEITLSRTTTANTLITTCTARDDDVSDDFCKCIPINEH